VKSINLAFVIILSVLTAFVTERVVASHSNTTQPQSVRESSYDHVMRTGILRCGYSVWKPFMYVDPNTKEKLGIFRDLSEEIARRYNLKVEWTEEVGWGEVVTALTSQRFDVACSAYWANTNRGKQLYFTNPVFYSRSYVWVRDSSTLQFNSYDQLNDSAYSFGYIDGGAEAKIINLRFPKARKQTIPELAPMSDLYEMVATGKVDFVAEDKASVDDYLQNKPHALRAAISTSPLILNPVVMMMAGGDDRLKQMLDNALREIELDGTLDQILVKYDAKDLFERNVY
jgi:polar amino acid transport system substrate-binding protein